MTEPLAPGSTIGILGGGQLGRMLSVAAARLGFRTAIFEPGVDCPASHVANCHHQAAYDDEAALCAFGQGVDVITYEFENIPTSALDILEAHAPIRPGREALQVSQDRITEKDFLTRLGLITAPYAQVDDAETLAAALATVGTPAILKTRRFGYDGKGQARLAEMGVRMGSHDDRSAEERDRWRSLGARIAEFPETADAVEAAAMAGDGVIMGAHNLVRGGSHKGNVSAAEQVMMGHVTALASDYHYPSLVRAMRLLARSGVMDLAAAWALVSSGPAGLLGLDDRGAFARGQRADLVVLEPETLRVMATIAGCRVGAMKAEVAARFIG